MERLLLRVRGKVTGVWYRASCREEARKLGVVGWVANRPDGSVEVLAEGSRPALERLMAWCNRGPAAAEVSLVDPEWLPASGEYKDFTIVR
ncbi:MAG: acylphosphatase [Myxococcales bacterium]|nr:acylphosphatase [Myxococcales bacterium]